MVKSWKCFLYNQEKKQGFPFSPLLLNKVLEVLTIEIRWEKEIKGIQIEREEVHLLLSADDMILYIGIPEVFTLKLWELKKNEFRKVSGYGINIQKSIAFVYTNNMSEREILKSNFKITSKS